MSAPLNGHLLWAAQNKINLYNDTVYPYQDGVGECTVAKTNYNRRLFGMYDLRVIQIKKFHQYRSESV